MYRGSLTLLLLSQNPAARYETKKEGPNKGRWFFTCNTRACTFFQWDTIQHLPSSPLTGVASVSPSSSISKRRTPTNAQKSDSSPIKTLTPKHTATITQPNDATPTKCIVNK